MTTGHGQICKPTFSLVDADTGRVYSRETLTTEAQRLADAVQGQLVRQGQAVIAVDSNTVSRALSILLTIPV